MAGWGGCRPQSLGALLAGRSPLSFTYGVSHMMRPAPLTARAMMTEYTIR